MSEISDDDARVAIAIRDDDDDDDDDGRGRTRRRDDARFGGAARTTRGEEEDADDEEDAPAAARTRAVSGAMAALEAMARGRRGARASVAEDGRRRFDDVAPAGRLELMRAIHAKKHSSVS